MSQRLKMMSVLKFLFIYVHGYSMFLYVKILLVIMVLFNVIRNQVEKIACILLVKYCSV